MRVDLSLYLVTDSAQAAAAGHALPNLVRKAVSGGVTAVQVREKEATAREFLHVVHGVADALPPDVALLVNDRVDVFLAARAAGTRVTGVHVGQSDLPPGAVRALVGPDAVIGLSTSTVDQVRAAAVDPAGVDYVGIGALHETRTKPDAPTPLGLRGFAEVAAASTLPAVAIGGVTGADLPGLRDAGAAGAAVASAVCSARDPGMAARGLRRSWEVSR